MNITRITYKIHFIYDQEADHHPTRDFTIFGERESDTRQYVKLLTK